ncbi:adhesion G-protein coupled receptor G2-like [Apostichopus japonicus]|uniref:adhesion G-protein coupled receptor G2-like n=1 Tax=Stichopus japonicus TaxID=307972 RepID=UPI003AB1864F
MDSDNNDAADDRSLNGILTSLEDQARTQISSGQSYTGVEENVALFNVVLNGTGERVSLSFGNFKLELSDPDESVLGELDQSMLRTTGDRIDTPQNAVLTSISLPKNIQTLTNGGSLMVSFFLYRDASLFQSTGQTVGLLGPSVRQVVGSQVIATIIHNVSASSTFNQSDQLVTTFTPIMVANENEQLLQDRICVFWDTDTLRWSTEGCTLNISSSSRVVCQCTHATSFAILVNVEEQNPVFTWISQIGVTISAFALLVTIFSILSVRKLREKTPWKVHVSLMLALLGLYLVFLFGADQTAYRNVCIVIAAVMHYFLLASFMWMFFEGVLLYKSIVNTRVNNTLPKFVWYSSVAAWGLPVLPAIAPTVLHYADDQYKLQEFYELEIYCFLKPDTLMMFVGLIGVMAGILAFNFLIFIMIVARLKRRRSDRTGQGFGRKLVTFVAIICLFGLTWFIGFFAIRDATFAVSVAFAALNAFQGFFIFLLFALREKAILQLWAAPCIGLKKIQSSKSASASSRRNGTKKSDGTASGAAHSNPSFSNGGPTTDG